MDDTSRQKLYSWDRTLPRKGNGLKRPLDWELLEEKEHKQMRDYVKALLKLYQDYPALYEYDDTPDGFEWINHIEAEKNMLTFLRKAEKKADTLVVVCNFSDLAYEAYAMGVPYARKKKKESTEKFLTVMMKALEVQA